MELRTDTINTIFNSAPATYQSAGAFQMQVPQSSVMVVRPLSYEFRVLEKLNEQGNVDKVTLQTRIWEHTNYGSGTVTQDWTDVPRIRVDANGNFL
jgi:hypothetical protein